MEGVQYEEDDQQPMPLIPARLWTVAYLSVPGVLRAATKNNAQRVAEVFAEPRADTAAPVPGLLPPPARSLKLPDPTPYEGDVKTLNSFIAALYNRVQGNFDHFPDERLKVAFGYACLSPSVQERLAPDFEHLRRPVPPTVTTLGQFVELLRRYFDDPAREMKASKRLLELRQKTRPFYDHRREFEEVLFDSQFGSAPDAVKIGLMQATLSPDLLETFIATPPPQTTFLAYADHLQNMDSRIRQYRPASARPAPHRERDTRHVAPAPAQLTVSQGGDAMDLDAASREKGPDGRLTTRAKDARRALRRCLRCNEEGHFSANCPLGQKIHPAATTEEVKE